MCPWKQVSKHYSLAEKESSAQKHKQKINQTKESKEKRHSIIPEGSNDLNTFLASGKSFSHALKHFLKVPMRQNRELKKQQNKWKRVKRSKNLTLAM